MEKLNNDQTVNSLLRISNGIDCKLEHPRWIGGGDQSYDYCKECAQKKVSTLQLANPDKKENYFVDGGWGTESDSTCSCETCGKSLLYSLTDCGVVQELDHFETVPPEYFTSISKETAYGLSVLFESGKHLPELSIRLSALSKTLNPFINDKH